MILTKKEGREGAFVTVHCYKNAPSTLFRYNRTADDNQTPSVTWPWAKYYQPWSCREWASLCFKVELCAWSKWSVSSVPAASIAYSIYCFNDAWEKMSVSHLHQWEKII